MEKLQGRRIVLASGSPRRSEILSLLGVGFEIIPSTFAEDLSKELEPEEYVTQTALAKGVQVFERLKDPMAIVLSADTIVQLDNEILEKPLNEIDAQRMLRSMSNRSHIVRTAVAIIQNKDGKMEVDRTIETTTVHFDRLTDEMIKAYISTGEPFDKAGSLMLFD